MSATPPWRSQLEQVTQAQQGRLRQSNLQVQSTFRSHLRGGIELGQNRLRGHDLLKMACQPSHEVISNHSTQVLTQIRNKTIDLPTDRTKESQYLSVEFSLAPAINACAIHGGGHLLRAIKIQNRGSTPIDLRLRAEVLPDGILLPHDTHLPRINSLQKLQCPPIALGINYRSYQTVSESFSARIRISLHSSKRELWCDTAAIKAHAYDEWIYDRPTLAGLCSFVQPNDAALQPLLDAVAQDLKQQSGDPALAGYQHQSPARIVALAEGIIHALKPITYINPPASFEKTGQKIRRHRQVIQEGRGTCLDLTVLSAALLEQCGVHPLIILVNGHAFFAVWLHEHLGLQNGILDQQDHPRLGRDLLNAIGEGTLLPINSTTACSNGNLEQATDEALNYLRTAAQGDTLRLIDVNACRHVGHTPLPY